MPDETDEKVVIRIGAIEILGWPLCFLNEDDWEAVKKIYRQPIVGADPDGTWYLLGKLPE